MNGIKSFIVGLLFVGLFAAGSMAQLGNAPIVPKQDEIKVVEVKDGNSFHKSVIRGAIKAQRDGKITRKQLRRIRVAMLSPAFREQVKELATVQMLSSGESDKIPRIGENIDWDALGDFLERIWPLVLQLLDVILAIA